MKKKIFLGIGIILGVLVLLFLIGLWQDIRMARRSYAPPMGGSSGFNAGRSTAYSTGLSNAMTKTSSLSDFFGASESSFSPPQLADNAPVSSIKGGGERLIIKTGRMTMVVEDMATAIRLLRTYVQEKDGFIVSSDLETVNDRPVATITLRIPAETFDVSVTVIRGFAKKVLGEFIRGDDVTEEYIDLGAQLKSLEVVEAQFVKILEKAERIDEILSVQRELQRVRSDIDRLKGRREYFEKNAAMATMTVHLSLDEASLPVLEEQQWRPWVQVKNAVRSLLVSLKSLVTLIIWFVIYAVIWVPLFFGSRFVYRWWKRKKAPSVS